MRRLFLVLFVGTVLLIASFLLALILGLVWTVVSGIASMAEACMVFVVVGVCLWKLSRKVRGK